MSGLHSLPLNARPKGRDRPGRVKAAARMQQRRFRTPDARDRRATRCSPLRFASGMLRDPGKAPGHLRRAAHRPDPAHLRHWAGVSFGRPSRPRVHTRRVRRAGARGLADTAPAFSWEHPRRGRTGCWVFDWPTGLLPCTCGAGVAGLACPSRTSSRPSTCGTGQVCPSGGQGGRSASHTSRGGNDGRSGHFDED
jgi:hypothetical protein